MASVAFTAQKSGAFTDPETWADGIVPSGDSSIIIPAGISISLTGSSLDFVVRTLTISGSLVIISTGGTGFSFAFGINIVVRAGGSLRDQTDNNRLYTRADSVLTFLPGASFTGKSTQLLTFTGAVGGQGVGATVTLGSTVSGPFTASISVDGTARRFRSVMCLARRSGRFRTPSTWLGGVAPTVDFCGSAGGCDLFVPGGFSLTTESLNGELDIQFNVIEVAAGGSLKLGTTGSSTGFRFKFKTTLNVYGSLEDVTSGAGGISITSGSGLNMFFGARFVSSGSVSLRIFNPTTGAIVGTGPSLSSATTGPLFVGVESDGEATTSTTGKCICQIV